ncbi:DUF4129 domain-containing protein [Streptomyces gilvosporeus]|uniref:Protein-glutamine gamma-glutamyltransferase-like C-terminal domain-containing protein n=1 Tax=Streptomyces gilvosporeus TaxID=553510 RepID=A0A1V0TRP7_9ACTN|nr:DUF4129 domain-containing protein [Streptomyces gilvosporeus]ARF55587.1 hypothetical protein B1H19_16615 [Streptomyces gilvosporeus]
MARSDDDIPLRTPRVPAREAAERELSDPRYHQHDPTVLQRALNWFWDRVDELFHTAAGATPGGWVGLVTVAAVVVLLIVALRLRLGAIRRTPTTGGTLFTDIPRTAAEHRAAADLLAADNLWSRAIQERMRALVLALEERALLTPGPGRTADEAVALVGRLLPAHADRLRAAARTFDDVTYGGRPGTEREYALLAALDSDLQHAKPSLTTAPARSRG